LAKLIPDQVTAQVKVSPWRWFLRIVLAAVLLAFGYAVAYVVSHWEPQDLEAYVVAPRKPAVKPETPPVVAPLPKPIFPVQKNDPQVSDLALRVQALEDLQGTVGNLSQVFLGQQLVILDNAYRQGGDVVPGVAHVKNFALSVAKNEGVAAALEDLQSVTPLGGPVTAAELVLTAEALYDMEPAVPARDPQKNWWQQVLASLKRWIKVTELDNPQDPGLSWDLAVNQVRYSIAHGDAQGALNILNQPPFLNVEQVKYFRDGLAQHIVQQQALHKVQEAFIESYQP
jgi:hypothetical protein